MAQPRGTRTRLKKPEKPTTLKQIQLTCKVTGKSFPGYEGQLPISNEGWDRLSDQQKWLIGSGAKISKVI